jgi:VanZ family protein
MPDPSPPDRRLTPWAALLGLTTVAYALVLLFATHYPKPEELIGRHAPGDKTLHFMAYGVLGFLATATLAAGRGWSVRGGLRLAAGLAAFGAIDEATQPFFSRAADPLDWVYDLIGIGCGLAAVVAVAWFARRGQWGRRGREIGSQ